MFRCHYCCAHCKAFWCEVWDEIETEPCRRCEVTAYPYRAQYVKPSTALERLFAFRDPNQLTLFGEPDA